MNLPAGAKQTQPAVPEQRTAINRAARVEQNACASGCGNAHSLHHPIIAGIAGRRAGQLIHALNQIRAAVEPAAEGVGITQHDFFGVVAKRDTNVIRRPLISASGLRPDGIQRQQRGVVLVARRGIHRHDSKSQLSVRLHVHQRGLQIAVVQHAGLRGIEQILFTRLQSDGLIQRGRGKIALRFNISDLHGIVGRPGKAHLANREGNRLARLVVRNHVDFQRLPAVIQMMIMHGDVPGQGVLVEQAGRGHLFRAVAVNQRHILRNQPGGTRRQQPVHVFLGEVQVNFAGVQIRETILGFCRLHGVAHVKNQLLRLAPLPKSVLHAQGHGILAGAEKRRRLAGLGVGLAAVRPRIGEARRRQLFPSLVVIAETNIHGLPDVHARIARAQIGNFRRFVSLQMILAADRLAPKIVLILNLIGYRVVAALTLIKQPVQALAALGVALAVRHRPKPLGNFVPGRVIAGIHIFNRLPGCRRLVGNRRHGSSDLQRSRQSYRDALVRRLVIDRAVHQFGYQAQRHKRAVIHDHRRNRHDVRLTVGINLAIPQINRNGLPALRHAHQIRFGIPNNRSVQNVLRNETQRQHGRALSRKRRSVNLHGSPAHIGGLAVQSQLDGVADCHCAADLTLHLAGGRSR